MILCAAIEDWEHKRSGDKEYANEKPTYSHLVLRTCVGSCTEKYIGMMLMPFFKSTDRKKRATPRGLAVEEGL
jgi:hypothetical protein